MDSNSYNRINDIREGLILKISISSMLIRYYAKWATDETKPSGGGGGWRVLDVQVFVYDLTGFESAARMMVVIAGAARWAGRGYLLGGTA
ncbi:hypothetical protein CV_1831 [Chromobacterium violaceum ATCC 12472]|uniref:Uncharacterized protein n=1 Tax=Chromobacterium violaceum (strain ATCC 12472 / DSM 30191 / JCM 1249 / CCUG 213 / NBRC 12614 / NCIMB 9131 / NCTC 9757 / MK) TaxID=243365 RepID=Q7NWZ8_CHRVO|nr:hypothetical protein CV_1831 [Chromobacterium violaceum ATCC 12472]